MPHRVYALHSAYPTAYQNPISPRSPLRWGWRCDCGAMSREFNSFSTEREARNAAHRHERRSNAKEGN